ncbi:hypothetical protein F4825DRAFT_227132 [Nemania diffusa]|nr:hypothetical protein F4825DRAFT_227132 [Nemania diffusa]
MGLLNFFSKKSYSNLTQRDSLKTCAYDTTVALSPPILGTYPVLGNGNKILEQFQKSHPNLGNVSPSSAQAPSPLIPRLRSDGLDSESRPRTAPSGRPGEVTDILSLQSHSRPELPLPPKKKYGPYKLPSKLSTNIQASSFTAKPALSPGLLSTYSDSIRSGESTKTKGYVDLLDARSMIKPYDFYSRVQATGARNYGEDVADRNMDERAASLNTSRAQGPLSDYADAKWTSAISKHVDDDSADELPRVPRIRHSMGSGLRSGSTNSDSFPKRTSSRLPPHDAHETPRAMTRTGSARSERAARRKSMPSFSPSSSSEIRQGSSSARRGKEKDPDLFPDSLRDRALAVTAHEREHTKPNISTKRQSLILPHVEQQLRQRPDDADKPLPAIPLPSRDRSRRRTISHHNALVESRLLVKRQSLQGIRSRSRGEVYEDTYQQKLSLQGGKAPRDRHSTRRQLGSTTDLQDSFYKSLARPLDQESQIICLTAKCTDNERELDQSNHIRKPSFISISSASILPHEIEASVPERASSFRRWSLTSETGMSTLSSNPFRPQSGHTTSTSVDFSPLFPHKYPDQSIPPVPDIPFLKPLESTPEDASTIRSEPYPLTAADRPQSSEFYLEDYASSNDSLSTPSRGSYEKDLLFSETGYGVSGDQMSCLPGLFDMSIADSSAGLSASGALENDLPYVSSLSPMPVYIESDSEDSFENREPTDSSDEINFDIPMSRANTSPCITRAPERLPTKRAPIEEVDSDF